MSGEVFLIHQDEALRTGARELLEAAGHKVSDSERWEAALPVLAKLSPSLILLPWTSEPVTRSELFQLKSAESTQHSRVILIALKSQMQEAIAALEYGAEDCLAIPFVPEELVGRVNACLRRPAFAEINGRRATGIYLDRISHRLFVNDEHVYLSPTEFRLMSFFVENPGRMFTREELLEHAWPRNIKAGGRTVDVHVRRIRRVLEPYGCEHVIQTVRGFGYRFSQEGRSPKSSALSGLIGQPRL